MSAAGLQPESVLALDALRRTGTTGPWLALGAITDGATADTGHAAQLLGLGYDAILLSETVPGLPAMIAGFVCDGACVSLVDGADGRIGVGPPIPLDEFLGRLCSDVGSVAEHGDVASSDVPESALAAVDLALGPDAASSEEDARGRLGTLSEDVDPAVMIDALCEDELLGRVDGRLEPGPALSGSPALTAAFSGGKLAIHRLTWGPDGIATAGRAIFVGHSGGRFAMLRGAEPGHVLIARPLERDLPFMLAELLVGLPGPRPMAVPGNVRGTSRIGTEAEVRVTASDLADLDSSLDPVLLGVLREPSAVLRITVDDSNGRARHGVSMADGAACVWSWGPDGGTVRAVELEGAGRAAIDTALDRGRSAGGAADVLVPAGDLRTLFDRLGTSIEQLARARRIRIGISAWFEGALVRASALVLDLGPEGVYLVIDETVEEGESVWRVGGADADAIAGWIERQIGL